MMLGRFGHASRVVSDLLVLALNVFALVLGIGSLLIAAVRRVRGVWLDALCGIALSLLLLSLWCANFTRAFTASGKGDGHISSFKNRGWDPGRDNRQIRPTNNK